MAKLLIAYYSLSNGNTEYVARKLHAVTGGDLLRIDTVVPYPDDYDTVVKQGHEEVNRGYEPELKPLNTNITDYDIIAIGTPTWWYTMAPAVKTFLHQNDLSDKTVVPFMTCGGWPGHTIADIKSACPDSTARCEMEVLFDSNGGDMLMTSVVDIDNWAKSVQQLL